MPTSSTRLLEPLVVPADDPAAILPRLEAALAGQASLLPIPADDAARAELLRSTLGVGKPIDEEVALVVGTSGSTGTPKGAELTAANLVSSADATHRRLGGEGQWLLAMPAHYIAGLQVLIRAMIAGVEPLCLDLRAGFRIPEFAAYARELHATGDRVYTSLTPMQLLKAMDTLEGIRALQLFDAILIGGAPLAQADRAAADRLGIRVVTTYGASETAGGCVYDGRPLPGATVRITGEERRILLGGPMIARGYRFHPDHEAFATPGWFATSDAGSLADGHLTVAGRLDAVIDTGGLKLHPEVLERALTALPGVSAACVVGVPDRRLGQRVVAAYAGAAQPAEVLAGLEDLPRWQWPRELQRLEALPLLSTGKVDRRGVVKLFSHQRGQ